MSKMQRKPPRPPMQLTCDACGKTFMRAPSKYKEKYNFCSEACAWAAHGKAVMGRAERVADRYKQERLKDMTRCASTRGCMRTLRDANRARREGRQHY